MKRIPIALVYLFAVSVHAATFTVVNLNDSGAGSLRAAISNANANTGPHLINFAIPPLDGTVKTITPLTPLPGLVKPVTIDGYTQDIAHPNTLTNDDNAVLLIELNGTTAGGSGDGLFIETNCVVRGLVINRFAINGISVNGRDTLIEGNFIGTDPTGTIKRPNGQGLLIGGVNTMVGGTAPAARNLISGNTNHGLATAGLGVTGIVIAGNFIGTDVHGTAALGNGGIGVRIITAASSTVGGTAAGAGNVIASNGGPGINIVTVGNLVQGNFIGTDLTGTLNLSNHLEGVSLTSSASGNEIGGAVGNVIAFNGGAGIRQAPNTPAGTNNLFSVNTILSNGGLGIDLEALGVTSNDVTDADSGVNHQQNFPVLTVATNITGGVQIQGFLNSTAGTAFTLEFFANPTCDPSGFGEGETFIGATNVTTAANGTNNFTVVFTNSVPDNQVITATATDPNHNTSEFSACRPISGVPPTVVGCSLLPALATNAVNTAHTVVATVTSNGLPRSGAPVNFSVTAGPNLGKTGTATTGASGQGSFTYTGTIVGTDTIRAIALAATGTATKVWIAATCPTITLAPAALPDGSTGVPYSQTITAGGGVPPRSFAITAGALPSGLSLSSAGTLSGTPGAMGVSVFTVTATDTNACTGHTDYTLTINSTPPVPHNFAVTSLTAPKKVTLTTGVAPKPGKVQVAIQNLGAQTEVITAATLPAFVTLHIESLGTCPTPTAVLQPLKPSMLTLRPGRSLKLTYLVTIACANDRLAGAGHEDYRYTVTVDPSVLDGNPDTVPANNVCPRPPNPAIGDKGCGNKNPATRQLGGPVLTDVFTK